MKLLVLILFICSAYLSVSGIRSMWLTQEANEVLIVISVICSGLFGIFLWLLEKKN